VLRGPNLCAGDLAALEAGAPPIVEHRTGDLARVDPDGRLVLLGRAKDMIIRGRHNVYPALHEAAAERVPGVRRCAMVGVWDDARADERVVLVVEPAAPVGAPAAREALAARVRRALREGPARVDDAAQPDLVLVVDRLPEAGRSRKVDREAVRALARAALDAAHR
jgi:acyl-CoA synthetase (AMP-forming)/AMP-acid ligase II